MSRVVVLGAGVSGHTAAAFARKWLDRRDEIVVVSPLPHYNWIPSNIWVGVGLMKPSQVTFPLAPVYERNRIDFRQARAVAIHPEGRGDDSTPFVVVESTRSGHEGESEEIRYDFLVNATGPKLNFGATEGLGPGGHSLSVCTESHAGETARALDEAVARMKRGERQRFLVGTGHGACTCEGAAFEYIVNLEFELRARERARPGRHRLDHQRIRARRLRHGRHAHPTRRLRDAQQDLRRVSLRRARDPLDHPGPRAARSKRAAPTTRRSRATRGRPGSTSPCSCLPSREWG